MKILVTGGAGYIGAHTCKLLAARGRTPVCYDNLVYGHRDAVQWGPLEEGDLLDRSRLDEVLERHRPEAVVHFAAFTYVGESVENPGKYYRNNVVGTLNLLEAMRDRQIRRIVFSSTCATYGEPEQIPITEDHPQSPINPYGASKWMIERMLSDFEAAHGMKSAALRYFNAAGADPDAEIGEDHDPETHLIPLVLDVALGRRKEISIFGDDYDTPDGTCIRDYIHIEDLADAHLRALALIQRGERQVICNLGTGEGFSVQQVLEVARRVTGHAIPASAGPRREGDPERLVSGGACARNRLGWSPGRTDLEDIVGDAWGFHKSHPQGYGS
jgi:UDP-arabinose 4-epimerase